MFAQPQLTQHTPSKGFRTYPTQSHVTTSEQQRRGSRKKARQPKTVLTVPLDPWQRVLAVDGCLSNLKPIGKRDRRNLQELRAARQNLETLRAEHISTCLRKLGLLGCYDAALYHSLTSCLRRAVSHRPQSCTPRHLSMALFSCSLSRHFDSNLDAVAGWISQMQHFKVWRPQHLSNALFAWAVLSATADADTPNMCVLARRLFKEVNSRGAGGFTVRNDLGKLYWAHREAQVVGLADGEMLKVDRRISAAAGTHLLRSVDSDLGDRFVGAAPARVTEAEAQDCGALRSAPPTSVLVNALPLHAAQTGARTGDVSELQAQQCGLLDGALLHAAVAEAQRVQQEVAEELGSVLQDVVGVLQGVAFEAGSSECVMDRQLGGLEAEGGTEGFAFCDPGNSASRVECSGMGEVGVGYSTLGGGLAYRVACSSVHIGTGSVVGEDCSKFSSSSSSSSINNGAGSSISDREHRESSKSSSSSSHHSMNRSPVASKQEGVSAWDLKTPGSSSFLVRHKRHLEPSMRKGDLKAIVITFTHQQDYARYPAGWMRGKAALRIAHAARECDGPLVLVNVDEWAALGGDVGKQAAYLGVCLQQAAQGVGTLG